MEFRDKVNNPKRLALYNLPLESLIEAPNCGFNCPKGKVLGEGFDCCCGDCGEYEGFFKDKDRDRLSKEDFVEIESLRTENGWHTVNGCNLPRSLRSEDCLRTVCLDFTEFEV